ncbi:LxmA leader domain family RiPP [Streptomyces sp. NPDC001093]|uniref:LxmA leader domain family RiPP n=1 Tax=Streptomyces sp. NPDC001093 TaxID=3154376 RepID=UPI003327BC78
MTETLISGYIAYTTADRLGASAEAEAPATSPTITVTTSSGVCSGIASAVISNATFGHGC